MPSMRIGRKRWLRRRDDCSRGAAEPSRSERSFDDEGSPVGSPLDIPSSAKPVTPRGCLRCKQPPISARRSRMRSAASSRRMKSAHSRTASTRCGRSTRSAAPMSTSSRASIAVRPRAPTTSSAGCCSSSARSRTRAPPASRPSCRTCAMRERIVAPSRTIRSPPATSPACSKRSGPTASSRWRFTIRSRSRTPSAAAPSRSPERRCSSTTSAR